jgi:hypothetical protein
MFLIKNISSRSECVWGRVYSIKESLIITCLHIYDFKNFRIDNAPYRLHAISTVFFVFVANNENFFMGRTNAHMYECTHVCMYSGTIY